MAPLPRVGSLEVAQDLEFERKSWRVQRIGWVVMALFVLAGLAGLLGSGPLSSARETAGDGVVVVEYERFARRLAPSQLKVHFGAQAVRGGEVRIWLDRRYVEKLVLQPVVPEPARVEAGGERLTFVFAAEAAGTVTFHLEFETFGLVTGGAGIGAAGVDFDQLVYP